MTGADPRGTPLAVGRRGPLWHHRPASPSTPQGLGCFPRKMVFVSFVEEDVSSRRVERLLMVVKEKIFRLGLAERAEDVQERGEQLLTSPGFLLVSVK